MNCKSFIIAALALGLSAAPVLADESVSTIVGAKKVAITENSNGLKAIVDTGTDTLVFEQAKQSATSASITITNSTISLLRTRKDSQSSVSWDLTSGGLGFGFCRALNAPGEAGIEMGKSFEISWLNILAMEATNRFGNKFSLGIGINWRNYRTTLGNCFTADRGYAAIGSYPAGTSPRLSRIKIFSLQFPLLYRQQLPFGLGKDKMALSFGPIFNVNTHASILTAWRENGKKTESKINDINVRPFTIDLYASLHVFGCCSFYARYSPYRALTGSLPLNFNQLSTGVVLFM